MEGAHSDPPNQFEQGPSRFVGDAAIRFVRVASEMASRNCATSAMTRNSSRRAIRRNGKRCRSVPKAHIADAGSGTSANRSRQREFNFAIAERLLDFVEQIASFQTCVVRRLCQGAVETRIIQSQE